MVTAKLIQGKDKYFPIEHEGNVYWCVTYENANPFGDEWWFIDWGTELELRCGVAEYRRTSVMVIAQHKKVLEGIPTIDVENLSNDIYVDDYFKSFPSKYDAQKAFITEPMRRNSLSIESTNKALKRLYEERDNLQKSIINIGDKFKDDLERILTVVSLYIPPVFVNEIEFLTSYDYDGEQRFEVFFDRELLKFERL